MKTIGEIGELGFIAKLPGVNLGDDCAEIPNGECTLLVTTDSLMEGVHFLREKIRPEDLGAKSVAVNVSDIAAMGGRPIGGFLSVAWTPDVTEDWLDRFVSGATEALRVYGVKLLGGDTNRSRHDIAITWTLMGSSPNDCVRRRSTAQVGDIICVTGALGDSKAGLECLIKGDLKFPQLIEAHVRPRAHLEEGIWLAKHSATRAMMDVSDGLWLDLPKLCKASSVGGKVRVEQLPTSIHLKDFSKSKNVDPQLEALAGGEDYVLLATVDSSKISLVAEEFAARFGGTLYAIGEIEESHVSFLYHGNEVSVSSFTHFAKN